LSVSIVKLGGSAAIAIGAAAGFSSMYYSLTYWEHAQTDEWAALCVIVGLLLLSLSWQHPFSRRRFLLIFLAGAVMGVGFIYKYTIGAAGILIFAPALVPNSSVRFYWRDLVWFVPGGLIVLLFAAAILGSAGAIGPFFEIQGFVTGYIENSTNNLAVSLQAVGIVLSFSSFNAAIVWFGVILFVVSAIRRGITLLHVVTVMLIATGFLSGFVQGKGFIYHFLPVLTGYAILFGLAVEFVLKTVNSRLTGQIGPVAAWSGLVVVLAVMPNLLTRNLEFVREVAQGAPLRERVAKFASQGDFSFPETLAFSDVLSKWRMPDETLFVWGFETSLYFLQDTSPVHRYPYAWPFAVEFYDDRYTQDLLNRLENAPPTYFVVQKKDATPWATGSQLDSKGVLRLHPPIYEFLQTRYRLVYEANRFELWENLSKTEKSGS